METMDALEEAEYPETEELLPARKRRQLRPEWILAIIAAAAALLLGAVLLMSRSYFPEKKPVLSEEDPEILLHQQAEELPWPPLETYLEPTVPETEPENPTIPPERNPYDRYDFQYNRHNYLLLQNLKSYAGVDVSAYQGDIDWARVRQSGIDFAIIRLGYRGYESGKLVEDEMAQTNLQNATEAGLPIGAYFFSQALNADEAFEDAYIALNGNGFLQHFGIAGEVRGKSLHLTGVAPFATPDVVVAYGTSGHYIHHPKAGVNATCHTGADDAMRLEVQNEVGNPHGCIHLSDSALLQNDVVVTKFSYGIV